MISVIVPVYNVQNYLDKCIHCILNQTYKEFELILVDDGSTDRSGIMCDEYALEDKRIKVIHKKNAGPSEARNIAASLAQGEYITFIDSDDFVTKDYLFKLNEVRIQTKADICAVLMKEIQENEEPKEKIGKEKAITMSGRNALLNVLYQKDLDTTPCGMLFKKDIVLANPFPKGRYHEDDFTMFKYFEESSIVSIIKKVKYFYVQHDTSIMHRKTSAILRDEIDASDNLEFYFQNKEADLLRAAKSKKYSNYCQIIIQHIELLRSNEKDYNKVVAYLKNNRLAIIFNPRTRMKNKLAAIILFCGVRTLHFIAKTIDH